MKLAIGRIIATVAVALFLIGSVIWLMGASNPSTPAGYIGYLTQGSVFGHTKFVGMQVGPTSAGRTWLLDVINVSVTPYTYTEHFAGESSVLSKDNLQINFEGHSVFSVRRDRVKDFMEKYSVLVEKGAVDKDPDLIVKKAYGNFIQQTFRTYLRDEIQQRDGLKIKDDMILIGQLVEKRIQEYAKDSPFSITNVVVGNIQYPKQVSDAVANKLAATQELLQRDTSISISRKDAERRLIDAEGIAKSMDVVQQKLTPLYIQHEAIEAQKAMVGSPNHTTVYIPVGNNGVPLVGTFDTTTGTIKK